MGFFNGLFRPTPAQRRTITGEPQPVPERPDTPQRRMRLFIQCLRAIEHDPLAAPDQRAPIGDGCGLEGLVTQVRPIFATDAGLIPWVALRGAMTLLYQDTWRDEGRVAPFVPTVELIMSVGHTGDIENADPTIGISPQFASRLTPDQSDAVLGIYSAVWYRLLRYEQYSQWPLDQVRATPLFPSLDVALDMIAWVAVATCRLGAQHELVSTYPKPDLLEAAGWYTEPLFGKAERYWDGRDWTSRCRTSNGEGSVPL